MQTGLRTFAWLLCLNVLYTQTRTLHSWGTFCECFSNTPHLHTQGLQDFIPENQSFDLVWIQWVAGYLTDADLVKFLRRCKSGLKSGGLIVVKDNMFHGFVLV